MDGQPSEQTKRHLPRQRALLRKGIVMDQSSRLLDALLLPLYKMPTGRKIFLAILVALAPLALLTLVANILSARAGDTERRALIAGANAEISNKIAANLLTDEQLVRRPLASLAVEGAALPAPDVTGDEAAPASAALPNSAFEIATACRDIKSALVANRGLAPEMHLLSERTGEHLCADAPMRSDASLERVMRNRRHVEINREMESLVNVIPLTDRHGTRMAAILIYPLPMLKEMAAPVVQMPPYDLFLVTGEEYLILSQQLGTAVPGARLSSTAPIGNLSATLEMNALRKSLSRNDVISFLAPIGMWVLAASLAWMLINHLILRPLSEMQSTVAHYRPGQRYQPFIRAPGTAVEIIDLENDMAKLSDMVADDKEALAKGLEQQTILTREVHHRVKNNLQIIASLLNIHSRSATAPGAHDAYRSIQRRVDALSAVHRNHFAELEDNEGIALRPLLSELAAGFRGVSPLDPAVQVRLSAESVQILQDVAVPIAFLVTEIGELALLTDPSQPLSFAVANVHDDGDVAELSIQSNSLKNSEMLEALLENRFGRVLLGLSRQLRQTLHHDGTLGRYHLRFPILR